LADIPGLIEGAAGGAGLGHEFLRHVRRTKVLVHVLDAAGGLEGRDPLEDFRTINAELAAFDDEMGAKPMLVALNKVDLVEARDNLPRLRDVLASEGHRIFEISAATGEGVPDLFNAVGEELREHAIREEEARKHQAEKPTRRVYTIGNVDERAWDVVRVAEDTFQVTGVGIERFTLMTNFDQWEAAERFQRVLDRSGITAELNRQGVQTGDTVQIATHELVWGEQEDEDGAFVVPDEAEEAEFEWLAEDDVTADRG
jgi:GTP-binding protein